MPKSSLDKYGDKALKPEEQEKAEELRQAKEQGTGESVYGPLALAGEGDREAVESAAEHGGMEVPSAAEEALAEAEGESPESEEETAESGSQASGETPEAEDGEAPEGYEIEHQGGGYYSVTTPDGDRVENPDVESGNWGGREVAVTAARHHASEQVEDNDGTSEALVGPDEQVSVDELRGILEAEPDMIDNRMHAEFARAEGPRPDALKVMLKAEEENEARENVISTLQNAIEDFGEE